MTDPATTCDECQADIPYGVTCYAVRTGRTWDGDDGDKGKPIVKIVCADCYTGDARGNPVSAVLDTVAAQEARGIERERWQ